MPVGTRGFSIVEALVRANLLEHCVGAGNAAVFERYKEQPAGQLALSIEQNAHFDKAPYG